MFATLDKQGLCLHINVVVLGHLGDSTDQGGAMVLGPGEIGGLPWWHFSTSRTLESDEMVKCLDFSVVLH